MTERKFKIGDRVKVLRHRNYMGDEFSGYGIPPGSTITLKDLDESLAGDGFVMFAVEDMGDGSSWIIRSDDIELLPATEQQASPIRTVTRREIVPGKYGMVWIGATNAARNEVDTSFSGAFNAIGFREVARIFNEIADVLEEQNG